MARGSFGLVWSGNLTFAEVAPFVNQTCDLLKFLSHFDLLSDQLVSPALWDTGPLVP